MSIIRRLDMPSSAVFFRQTAAQTFIPAFLPACMPGAISSNTRQREGSVLSSSADAYVDHPSFGHAIISRILQANGYTVGIISQPDWKDERSIRALGRPRLGFLVTGHRNQAGWNVSAGRTSNHNAPSAGGLPQCRPESPGSLYNFGVSGSHRQWTCGTLPL